MKYLQITGISCCLFICVVTYTRFTSHREVFDRVQVNKHSINLIHNTSNNINASLVLTILWFINFCFYSKIKVWGRFKSCTFRTAQYKLTSHSLYGEALFHSCVFTLLTWPHLTMQKAALVSVLLSIWIRMKRSNWTIVRISSQSEHDSIWTKKWRVLYELYNLV